MLLAIDIGNTNIVVGCFENGKLLTEFRVKTDLGRTRDEYDATLITLLNRRIKQDLVFEAAIVSSVVPPLTIPMCEVVKLEFHVEPIVVSSKLNLDGIKLMIDEPMSLGADRIADIVAAKIEYGLPSLVLDFGTATTVDYIDRDGCYRGGTISPGLHVALDALIKKTAQLPRVGQVFPETVLATNTITAIQAGTLIGYEYLVSGLIERVEKDAHEHFEKIVFTGGIGSLFSDRLNLLAREKGEKERIVYDSGLTLKGIYYLWTLNR